MAEAQGGAGDFGRSHPAIADTPQGNLPYVVTGYPTYVVIDREMQILTADLWPFDVAFVLGLI